MSLNKKNHEETGPERQFLWKLSDACSSHGATHNHNSNTSLSLNDIPEKCQRDIAALRKILPKVEESFTPSKQPHASDVAHLCDFYQSVLKGGFCPHAAPLLFHHASGQIAQEVLPRVFCLYQHLTSKAIHSNTTAKESASSPTVATTIGTTIAHMLAFIPGQRLEQCTVRDLIHLCVDLAVTCHVLEQQHDNGDGIQISLFGETLSQSQSVEEYILAVPDLDSLYILWSTTLLVVESVLKLQKEKRLDYASYETTETLELTNLSSAYPDASWSIALQDGALLSTILASIRKVLLSSKVSKTTTDHARSFCLVMRCKVAAAKLLLVLLEDWNLCCCSPDELILTNISLLVSQTVYVHFQDIDYRLEQGQLLASKYELEFTSLCSMLLCNAILLPPIMGASSSSSSSSSSVLYAVRATSLLPLFDCLPYIAASVVNDVDDDDDGPYVRDDVNLVVTVLRIIHASLYTTTSIDDDGSISLVQVARNHCATSQRLSPCLFQLLKSSHSADVALRILLAMLSLDKPSIDVPSVCQLVWALQKSNDEKRQPVVPPRAAAAAGTKRPRSSSQQRSPMLRLELSPKRQRTNTRAARGIIGQAELATPSPTSGDLSFPASSSVGSIERVGKSNASCQESLGTMLFESALHSKRIVAMVDPCRALFEWTSPASVDPAGETKQGVYKAVMAVSYACRLVLSLLATEKFVDDGEEHAVLHVAGLLSSAVKAVALSLSSHQKKMNDRRADLMATQSIHAIVQVGLEVQFLAGRLSSILPIDSQDMLAECLDAVALCAQEAWKACQVNEESDKDKRAEQAAEETNYWHGKTNRACHGVCCDVRKVLSSGRSDSCPEDRVSCFCGLLRVPDALKCDAIHADAFQYDCSIMLYGQVSTGGICALLSSLRASTDDIESAGTTNPMGELFSSSPSRKPIPPAVLALSPLFLLSMAVMSRFTHGRSKVSVQDVPVDDQATLPEQQSDDCVAMATCLSKVQQKKFVEAVRGGSDALVFAAFSAIKRLQELSNITLIEAAPAQFEILGRLCQGPAGVLAFILDRPVETELLKTSDDDQRLLKDPRIDVLRETYRANRTLLLSMAVTEVFESRTVDVRLAAWKCIAYTCLHSTVNEMFQIKTSPERTETKGSNDLVFEGSLVVDEHSTMSKKATSLIWILRSVFADPSSAFRFAAAKVVGRVLLAKKSSLLFALFSTPSNWRRQDDERGLDEYSEESVLCSLLEHVVAPLFQEVDRLLCRHCQVPQSQLSFTMGASMVNDKSVSGPSLMTGATSATDVMSFQRSAIMALSSLCQYADIETRCGLLVFEHSMSRLIRFWTALDSEQGQNTQGDAGKVTSSSALAYGEIVRLHRLRNLRKTLLQESGERFMPRLFSEILIPSTSMISSPEVPGVVERENRETQFRLLLTFIGSFLLPPSDGDPCSVKSPTIYGSHCINSVLEFVETVLPSVITAFTMVKDHDSLLLLTGFKWFLLGEKRKMDKAVKRGSKIPTNNNSSLLSDQVLGCNPQTLAHMSRKPGIDSTRKELVEHTKLLCLSPGKIEQILPRILMNPDRSTLIYFLEVVLQKKMSLHQMIESRDKLILKGIIWEYGRISDLGSADHGIRTAARARESPSLSGVSSIGSRQGSEDTDAASLWVTSSFMYLLVNIVQYRWQSRTIRERTRALRCLRWMIKFLSPSEAPQYLPQIMATINVVMSEDIELSHRIQSGTWQLRLYTVQALSEFIRAAIQSQYETIGESLATIVVSLFPVLLPGTGTAQHESERRPYEEAGKVAVDLLEFLARGDLGKNLAPYFRDVPFLPPTKALDKVRETLKTHGVSFDNLIVFSSKQNTQYAMSIRGSLTSQGDNSTGDGDKSTGPSYGISAQAALRKRLHVLRRLVSHENVQVRRAVLRHVIDLLRANRGLLQRLIENEEGTSLDHFITIRYRSSKSDSETEAMNGSVTTMVDSLLHRSFTEVDPETRLLIACCWGEMGAIDVHRLGEMSLSGSLLAEQAADDGRSWRLSQAPWQSRPIRYELTLVTNHLVVALKAAPTSLDQHKIAFAIQQILVLLDESVKMSSRSDGDTGFVNINSAMVKSSRTQMSDWLREKLSKAGVLETIEPYWSSNFTEVESPKVKEPPFFRGATSYFGWLSNWCRYMLKRSNDDGRNQWCSLFYACRTAIRSQAGVSLAEFLLPLLVLDRMCFGNGNDERAVVQEFLNVLDFGHMDQAGNLDIRMSQTERQKAVNCVFMVLDTLQYWEEHETEERYHNSRSSTSTRSARRSSKGEVDMAENACWLWEESSSAIESLLKAVPLSLQANAAAAVDMHARALRLMEMAERAAVVRTVYDMEVAGAAQSKSEGNNKIAFNYGDMDLFKTVLGRLNDCETMEGVSAISDVSSSALDGIRVKEAKGDWEGALYEYERALQLNDTPESRSGLQRGSLRCLLELKQFENVLHQASGIGYNRPSTQGRQSSTSLDHPPLSEIHTAPFAIEAAWRLGRWSTLTEILDSVDRERPKERRLDPDILYQVSVGRAIHGLQKRSCAKALSSIKTARQAVMSSLSNVARDSYSRSYPYLIRLQCLRELENACPLMCSPEQETSMLRIGEIASSYSSEGWNWDGRLKVVSVSESSEIIDVRLALARIAGDSLLEGSLFLEVGTTARKSGLVHVAANFLAQAEACCLRSSRDSNMDAPTAAHVNDLLSSTRLQFAKLKHLNEESSAALRLLGLENVAGLVDSDDKSLQTFVMRHESNATVMLANGGRDRASEVNRFSRRLLQSTQWMVEGGIKGGSEVMDRFRIVQRLSPTLEKGYFQHAKYVDSVLESRISALSNRAGEGQQVSGDESFIRGSVVLQDQSCQRYLLLAMEQYVNALKFSSKHVYQALPRLLSLWFDFTSFQLAELEVGAGTKSQRPEEAAAKYQMEANELLSRNIRTIPASAFYTAMPQLVSHLAHRNKETAVVVCTILTRILTKHPEQAMWGLAWLLNSANPDRKRFGDEIFKGAQSSLLKRKETKSLSLLTSSKSLFRFLIDLAKFEPQKEGARSLNVKSWRGDAELADFIPPVQAALSVSVNNASGSDAFPSMLPRMRTFCSQVTIMTSKAKPKRLKAFVVPDGERHSRRDSSSSSDSKEPQSCDMGELHFLVKQEERGDLRKDARVQDLNNVINRLLAASGGSRRRRRLHLRTYSVTCLSEDCGILEWVPNTQSMRSLVIHSYNPQASPSSTRRRGKGIGNYGSNMTLKSSFEKCQSVFFKNGNLKRATAMFEEACLHPYPPLLYWYFVQQFMDPHSWYEARTRFTLSCAAWSAVGHVIGLGDRHSENILIDTNSGQCVHVDFDCLFDKGLNLPKPEVVPFRLTPNMLDAFGPIGADGIYTGSLKAAMTTLRDNRDTLLSVLEPFLKDPIIDWKRQRSQQKRGKASSSEQDAKRSIKVIDDRLRGVYNLRNPNFKKVKRTDGWSMDRDDEMMQMLPLSVEGQVHKMITEATSHENLLQLYVGWMPWL